MPSDRVRAILPPDTSATWDAIAPVLPPVAYLGGGTAIAVHLGHRVSRDLDFFFHQESIDLDELARRLNAAGPFAVTERSAGTLNGVFSATKVQFLHADEARAQHLLEPPEEVDGLQIAGLSDLLAMKLKVVGDRGELRDYFDLMTIEQRTGRTADEGLALFVARFEPEYPQEAINHILLGLGYFDDVDPDDALPVSRDQIVDYWTRRQPEIVAASGRLATRWSHRKKAPAVMSWSPGLAGRPGRCRCRRSRRRRRRWRPQGPGVVSADEPDRVLCAEGGEGEGTAGLPGSRPQQPAGHLRPPARGSGHDPQIRVRRGEPGGLPQPRRGFLRPGHDGEHCPPASQRRAKAVTASAAAAERPRPTATLRAPRPSASSVSWGTPRRRRPRSFREVLAGNFPRFPSPRRPSDGGRRLSC